MPHQMTVEITPSASALVESLRGLGYSPETAIADLIDNSIAAGAANIAVDVQWNDGSPQIAIFDDGAGMDEQATAQAMRFGGAGFAAVRSVSDLGRFGLGLKTASLSQCRELTVISRQNEMTAALRLDIDFVAAHGWVALVPEPLPTHPLVTQLLRRANGTVVLWSRMDALGGLFGLDQDTFFLRIEDIRAHLGMVFHRFLDGDARRLAVTVNGRRVKAWDPFQRQNTSVTAMRMETLRHGGSSLTVKPFVLPHRDRFDNDVEYTSAGGPGGWAARQGFYVYRAKRLLVAGSWLGLGGIRAWTREESSRLARIAIDLPTDLDEDWRIDVRKAQARPPGVLRARLTGIASRCRTQAREVFAWRGGGGRPAGAITATEPVWVADETAAGTRFRVNRRHPAVAAFLAASSAHAGASEAILTLIERTVPVERIWLDVSDAQGTPPPVLSEVEWRSVGARLLDLARLLPETLSAEARADILLTGLPGQNDYLRTFLINELEKAA